MVKYLYSLLAIGFVGLVSPEVQAQSPKSGGQLSLRDITSAKYAARSAGAGMTSTADGEHYTMISPDRSSLLRYSFATGKLVDTLFSTSRARECNFKTFDHYQISSDGKHILIETETTPLYRRSYQTKVFHYDVRRNRVESLSSTDAPVRIPTFSPDGRMVAFVRDGDIYIRKFDFDTEVRVTQDARPNQVMNGVTDWVYEEEFSQTNTITWSEDNGYLAFLKTDESAVPTYQMEMFGTGLYPYLYPYKYPKAGETNSKVSVHIYNVNDRNEKVVPIKSEEAYYIPRIQFVGRNGSLAVMTLNRQQNHFRLFYVDDKTLIPKLTFEERNKAYIDSELLLALQFTSRGFVYPSERSGYTHLYLFNDRGLMERQLTSGDWDVTEFYGTDKEGNVYYQAANTSPTERNIFVTDTKGRQTRLGVGGGTNDAIFSNTFAYFINRYSNLSTPTITAVYQTRGNKELRVLEDNAKLRERLSSLPLPKKELTTIKLESGISVNAWITKPYDFDPNRKYPALLVQYSGPNSQEVRNRYGFGWEYYLAEQGIIVISADGRGTGARGEEWRKCTYMKLGVLESDDQIAIARAIGKYSYIDANRIGIWGWSFGGYNTLMALCRGAGTFRLGIAVAPVVDWRFYDTIYTERFMRTPQENPSGYDASSPLKLARQLRGKLLLIHGSADDNVHVQNSMRFTEELVQNNIPFDMAIYTDKNHGIYGGNTRYHLYQRMVNYLLLNL